jgi:hypothetical protein
VKTTIPLVLIALTVAAGRLGQNRAKLGQEVTWTVRVLNTFIILWTLLLMVPGISSARIIPFTMSELADLPRRANGLTVYVRAAKDTVFLGEPIMVEVFLHNAGSDTISDPCLLHPYDGRLVFYAIPSDSDAVPIRPEIHRTVHVPPPLVIPPLRCVGGALIFGSKGLVPLGTARGPGEYYAHHFDDTGWHKFLVTYRPEPGSDHEGKQINGTFIISNQDSFYVAEPSGWDKTVYEVIGDTLFSPESRQGTPMTFQTKEWEKDPAFWEALCAWDSTSVYAPWLWAGRARCAFKSGGEDSLRWRAAIEVMNELVRRFPGHRFCQETEFNIAAMLCFSGRGSEAKEQFDRLSRKYAENVRAYETCRPNPKERAIEWVGLRDDLTVGAGACPDVGETP